MMFEMILV